MSQVYKIGSGCFRYVVSFKLECSFEEAQQRKQHFGLIENAFIRLVDGKNDQEILKYNLTEDYSGMTAMIFGEIYRYNGEWKFGAIGQGTRDGGIGEMAARFQK